MSEQVTDEQKAKDELIGEIRSLIDEKVQNIPMIIEEGIQKRSGISLTAPILIMDLMEDFMGVESLPFVKQPADWLNPTPVFFSSLVNTRGVRVRIMTAALQSPIKERGAKHVSFVLLDSTNGIMQHRIKEHLAEDFDVSSGDTIIAGTSSYRQLSVVRQFIAVLSPALKQFS